jgi:predicted transcriptional regulator
MPVRRAKPAARTSSQMLRPKKIRNNGMVASTILLHPDVDARLTILAFAKQEERSALAGRFILQALDRHDVSKDLMKVAQQFKKGASVESDETADRPGDGDGVSPGSDAA